jgi:arabinose-5-phosphate isomerase
MEKLMNLMERAEEILRIQKDAVSNLQITKSWQKIIKKIIFVVENHGRIVTTGMGKAGIIAQKMSATLASIGIPSFYTHPSESLHGDIGRIIPGDLVIVFSHSGNTNEVKQMISHLHILNKHKNQIVVITGNPEAEISYDQLLYYGKIVESSVVRKVPSSSTTIMLIISDVLAISAAESLGFCDDWFKKRHPGGSIGKSYTKNEKH